MRIRFLAVLLALPSAAFAAPYTLTDRGDFTPVGHRVEFADRFGWESYQARFEFGLDGTGRSLTRESKLSLRIVKRDGKIWDYACRAKGRGGLIANVNYLHGQGISVVAECRIDEDEFAKAVGLDKEDVGLPNLVFQAMVRGGEVFPGAHRGLYFLPGAQIESSELSSYASRDDDPSNLSVPFRSN